MLYIARTTLVLGILALFAWTPTTIKAEPEEGDWKGGWNTWAEAAVGDWVEYEMGIITIRFEVTEVDGDKITYTHTNFMNDKQTMQKERTAKWQKIRPLQKLPYGKEDEVEWDDNETEINGETVDCKVASWSMTDDGGRDGKKGKGDSTVRTEIWYSRAVPCGGIVQVTSKGTASYTIKGFKKVGGKPEKSSLPKFYAKEGNYAVYSVTRGGRKEFTRVEVTEVTKDATTWTSTACDKAGEIAEDAEPEENELTKKTWDEKYGEPDETDKTMKAGGEEYTCNHYKHDDDTQEWITEDGLLVMKLVKTSDGTEVYTLERFEME